MNGGMDGSNGRKWHGDAKKAQQPTFAQRMAIQNRDYELATAVLDVSFHRIIRPL